MAYAAGLSAWQLTELLSAHDQAIASGQGVLKDDTRTAVTRVRCGAEWVCVKEYREAGTAESLKGLVCGSRLRRAWRGAVRLAVKGVSAPELLAVLRRGPKAYLVTRYVEGSAPLKKLLPTRFAGPLPGAELRAKRMLIRQLAGWLRDIHDKGIYHDDWSAKNILAAERDGNWAFYLLDFESLSARKRLTYRRRVKNLGQLADVPGGATATDKMRFLVTYAAGDRELTRGRFPRDVLRYALRRAQARERREAKLRRAIR